MNTKQLHGAIPCESLDLVSIQLGRIQPDDQNELVALSVVALVVGVIDSAHLNAYASVVYSSIRGARAVVSK